MIRRIKGKITIITRHGYVDCLYSVPKGGDTFPLVFYTHGGGFISGSGFMIQSSPIHKAAKKLPFVLISPSYTLMKEVGTGYPLQFEQCYDVLKYVLENAETFHIDTSKVILAGDSAGGNLCTALTMKMVEEGIKIKAHMPLYPMLSALETSTNFTSKTRLWNGKKNKLAWARYLANIKGDIPYEASPSLKKDLKGMPPCFTYISRNEPFYEETLDYVARLRQAGVEARCDIYESHYHAFDLAYPLTKNSRKATTSYIEALKEFLK